MMKFHSCRTAVSDAGGRSCQNDTLWKAQSQLVREQLLQDNLTKFRDLRIMPCEMRRVSDCAPIAVDDGLKRGDILDGSVVAARSNPSLNTRQLGSKRFCKTDTTRVLLAEDDVVVAVDLAWELEALGTMVVVRVSSLEDALERINGGQTDFALLNVVLQNSCSYSAARQLKALGIPCAFFTGLEKSEIEHEFLAVPHLSKPQCAKAVAKSVSDLVRTSSPMLALSKTKLQRH